ncbi:MAG: chain-length determining protein [Bacteroidales bacterium]|nr:chain-length determining protein [Bacteroidales bacterium]
MLYPELFSTNDFIVSLADIQIQTSDGQVKANLFTYLKDYQQVTFYTVPFKWLRRQILSLIPRDRVSGESTSDGKMNPYRLSDEQNSIIEVIRSNISCDVDVKTQMVTISVTDQDRLVCALLADSIRVKLQDFIINYRTKKARVDVEYYQQLTNAAKEDYEAALKVYGDYCDANRDIILQSAISKRDELEGDVQLKYNAYTAMNSQLEASKAKLQERTPAFTLLQGAAVPIKPAGPKRIIFIVAMLFLATLVALIYIYRKEIVDQILTPAKKSRDLATEEGEVDLDE